jgi:hypothetical protein
MVQQVLGEAKGKCDTDLPDVGTAAASASTAPNPGTQVTPGRVGKQGAALALISLNRIIRSMLMARARNQSQMPTFPGRRSHHWHPGMLENVREQVARAL